ncbi:hypothetical protein TRFO_20812 [Tritrichomonas foetus]|uniref:Uncharacterized protein n=1 Tax=Tritrichomonas foetus TaxID=1144522 RepID=A0A1J4KL27_9EUKA|nr:hypothetical protein TRFO_20812 [Tritrichomonas foetus]|eukprot:OHT10077.1 hypothetical protein TRFO_20812 [Tritrichomonas foetus]
MSKEDKHEKKQQIRQKPVPIPLPNPVPIQQTPVVNIEEIVVTETFAPVVTGQNAHTVHDKIEIEQIIEPISVLSPHQQNSASIWAQISPTEFDDKHEFRKLPAELKRSHKVRSPVKDSINQQDEEENSTPKQQKEKENKKSKSTPKRHKKIEQIQNEKEEFIVENRIEDMEDSDIPKPVFPTTEEVQETSNQKPIAIIENQASPWREIRQALSVAEPFDDKHEVRKLAPELRRSHTKQIQQQEIAPTSTINEVEENGGRKSGKQHSPKHEKKQNQQKKAQNQRFEEEVFTSNHEPIHSQHVIASKDIIVNDSKVENLSPTKPIKQSALSVALEEVEAPYDDSKDVRKLPPQLRRTHQNQTLQTEEKKSSESSKKEKKEKQTKQQNTLKSTKKNKNVEKNIEIPEKIEEDKIAPQSLSPTVSSAWANLTIRPESPKSTLKTAPKPVQTVAVPVVTAVEPVVTVAEPVLNLNNEVEKDENIEEETYSPRTLPKIDPTNPWTLLTEEELVKPKILTPNTKSSPKATKQVLEEPKEEEIQEPIQVQEIIEPVMKDEIKEENVLEEEEVSFEVQDLKPSPEKVKAWAVLSPSDKYDDSRDYRKTPAELRRSHAKAIQQDKNSPKENEKDDKNESNKNITPKKDKNANKQEKTKKQNKHKNLEQLNNLNQEQENSVNEPFVKEYKEASYSKDPQIEIVQLSPRNETWSLALSQVDAPYDDSRDVNKLPPELRRTHKKNTEILNEQEQTKKSPKNSSKKPEKQKEKNQNKIENQNVKMEISEIKEEIQQKVEEKSPQKINSPWSVALSNHNIPYDDSRDVNKLPPELRRSHKKVEPSEESPQENKQAPKSPRSPKKSSKIKVEAKHEILNQEEKEIQKPESPKLKKDSIWASIQIKPDPPKPTIQKVPQQETRMEVKENLETQKEEETEIIQTEPPKIQENQDSEQKEENSLQKIECEEEEKTEVEIVPTQSLKKPAGPWGTIKIEPFNDARQYGLVPAQLKRSHQIPSPKQEKLESPRNNNQYEKRENEQKRKNGNQQKKNNNNIHKQNFRNNEPHFEEEILNDEELYLTPANEEENPNLQQNIENTPEMPVSPLRRNVASAWVAATSSMKK